MPFVSALVTAALTLVLAVTPAINPPGAGGEPEFPAAPGYLLPWAGGEIHAVTQGEDTSFTHNGLAAYAFDFDLNYETVVAARPGRVAMVREDSNAGGCSPFYANSSNYVLIDHGDGMASLYLHLAHDSVEVEVGQIVARGEPIAISGETGVTCSDVDGGPGPHLHFQVQPYVEGKYYTQSQPVAFDDISTNEGVPSYGESFVSGNYGPGKPQKIRLTPWRVPRVFDPRAVPLLPSLKQAEDPGIIEEAPPPEDTATSTPTAPPLAESLITPVPSETAEPAATETSTPEPSPTETPVPPTPPPPAPNTSTPEPPTPASTETPTPEPDTPTPEPPPP